MIEIIILAVIIYFAIQILLRRKDSDVTDKSTGKGPEAVPKDDEGEPDPEIARGLLDLGKFLKERDREKLKLKRSVGVIISMLKKEGIPIDHEGTFIHNVFDSVDVVFTVAYNEAATENDKAAKEYRAEYHIEFTDKPDTGVWFFYVEITPGSGKKLYAILPHMAKAEYDVDGLAGEYHVLEDEVIKTIKDKCGLKTDRLSGVLCTDADFQFYVKSDADVAEDFLHPEEHMPKVSWRYCDYKGFDPESRFKYVRSRYYL